jgi:hypothetical protein
MVFHLHRTAFWLAGWLALASMSILCGCETTPDGAPLTDATSVDTTVGGSDTSIGADLLGATDAQDSAEVDSLGQDTTADGSATDDTPLLTDCAPPVTAEPGSGTNGAGQAYFVAETDHYRLEAEADAVETAALARLLEASYKPLKQWFGAEPPLVGADRLVVKFYATTEHWQAGLAADGVSAPASAGGYYAPTTRVAYLFRQGDPWYTQVLLLHEAIHQFHFLAADIQTSLPVWYVEGIAEFLSRHDWDGACVRLGQVPLLSWDDRPASAQQKVVSGSWDAANLINDAANDDRDLAWALVGTLSSGKDNNGQPHFQTPWNALRKLLDGGQALDQAVQASFPDLTGMNTALKSFVSQHQQLWQPIYVQWVHLTPSSLRGVVDNAVSIALVKNSQKSLQATLPGPLASNCSVGIVYSYASPSEWEALLWQSNGNVDAFTVKPSGALWTTVGKAPAPSVLALAHNNGQATVSFGDVAIERTPLFPARLGLALSNCDTVFSGLMWQ